MLANIETFPNPKAYFSSYCQNGTKTSDPFRNDTTLRPYACTPGTYCVAGTGSNEVREDVVGYAQPCHAGFFCEAASPSAKGSGACPPSFECPKGTATPRPTPKGFYAEHPGTIESTACLPGFYAPTIQTDKCELTCFVECDVWRYRWQLIYASLFVALQSRLRVPPWDILQ